MQADSYFKIGKTHKVCEDYASHKGGDQPYLIVTDGCSSATNTDIGSRILTKITEQELYKSYGNYPELFKTILDNSAEIINQLKVPYDALAATLLFAKLDGKTIDVCAIGDGFILVKYKETLIIKEIKFKTNAPYYLKYKIINEESYLKQYPPDAEIHTTIYNGKEKTFTDIEHITLTKEKHWFSFSIDTENLEFLAITSDGLGSFVKIETTNTSRIQVPINPCEVSLNLMNFKNNTGEFLHRRCNKLFKSYEKEDKYHLDDFSMAVFYNG